MQIPKRRYDKVYERPDVNVSELKYCQLKNKLQVLKNVSRFKAMEEVARLAEMGDFSENHAYQVAKGRLRGINAKILEIEDYLKHAVIIKQSVGGEIVRLGSTVTVAIDGELKTYRILGATETNPTGGVISHLSPIGSALIGHRVGDEVEVALAKRSVKYLIKAIS